MPSAEDLPRRLFTRSEYYALAWIGILSPDERLELIEGQIFHKSPPTPRHAACVRRLANVFLRQADGKYTVGVVSPVVLDNLSETRPDLTLLLERGDFYSNSHPTPRDVHLLIEVADTTIELDRTLKIPLYAKGGIPEVWLVDLTQNSLEAHREPSGSAYQDVRQLRAGDRVSPKAFPELELNVSDLRLDVRAPKPEEKWAGFPQALHTSRWEGG